MELKEFYKNEKIEKLFDNIDVEVRYFYDDVFSELDEEDEEYKLLLEIDENDDEIEEKITKIFEEKLQDKINYLENEIYKLQSKIDNI